MADSASLIDIWGSFKTCRRLYFGGTSGDLKPSRGLLSEICQMGYLPASSNAGLPGWPKSCEAGGLIGRPSRLTRRMVDSSRIWTAAQCAVWIGAEDGLRNRQY